MKQALILTLFFAAVICTTSAKPRPQHVNKRFLEIFSTFKLKDKFNNFLDTVGDKVSTVKDNVYYYANKTQHAFNTFRDGYFGDTIDNAYDAAYSIANRTRKAVKRIKKGAYKFADSAQEIAFKIARSQYNMLNGTEQMDNYEWLVAHLVYVTEEEGYAQDGCERACLSSADSVIPFIGSALFGNYACPPLCTGAVAIANDIAEKYQNNINDDDGDDDDEDDDNIGF